MRIYTEYSGPDFNFWGGAEDTVKYLTDGEVEYIFQILEDSYPDGMGETEVNDFFWFEDDIIAEWLDWPDWETLYKARSGEIWYDSYSDYELALETDEEEEEEEEEED